MRECYILETDNMKEDIKAILSYTILIVTIIEDTIVSPDKTCNNFPLN